MKGLEEEEEEVDVDVDGRRRRRSLGDDRRISIYLLCIIAIGIVVGVGDGGIIGDGITGWVGRALERLQLRRTSTALEKAKAMMMHTPLIDTHIDTPIALRVLTSGKPDMLDMTEENATWHSSIPKLRRGQVGMVWWSAFWECPPGTEGRPIEDEHRDLGKRSWTVRDTLEQIDTIRWMVARYGDTFQLATSHKEAQRAFHRRDRRIASLIGVEGGHQLGNSLSVLRTYYSLGVRYLTLTHRCHNIFADSCDAHPALHGGLSDMGRALVREMNRLGMLIDLSHVSDQTMEDALRLTEAPVLFSHSSARALYDVPRNVPDHILRLLKETESVVSINFYPNFVGPDPDSNTTTLSRVADHIDHIASICGHRCVGLGSDFDGIDSVPVGLEDTSKYPDLIAELIKRGWTDSQVMDLLSRNVLRVLKRVEDVRDRKAHVQWDWTRWSGRLSWDD